jgi:phosphoglycolate phosphatase-like HAD superfamily hydrolase
MINKIFLFCVLSAPLALFSGCKEAVKTDVLPSWNNTVAKQNIINYVETVTNEKNKAFIPIEDRIAVFDNDGTLWSEQPLFFQAVYALDFIRNNHKDHPEWVKNPTLKEVIDDGHIDFSKVGVPEIMDIVAVSHTNISAEQFRKNVTDWLQTAKHPTKGMAFNEMTFQPMIELLAYLRANNFKTYIVSGGGVDFIRVFAEKAYGIPPEQVIGSSLKTEFVHDSTGTHIEKLDELNFLDDKEGKPIMINQVIGKKPVFCAGNSDGDLQMMQWTASNNYKTFNLLVHHTDAEREFAYDKNNPIGRLEEALEEAQKNSWTIVDIKNDWKAIYPSK